LNRIKKVALYFAQKPFCRKAIEERADLLAFKEKLTPAIVVGIVLILFSYVIGMPAVIALGGIAIALKEPLIGIIGGLLIYGISTLIFIIGIKLAGKRYIKVLFRWLARVILEKILGNDIKACEPQAAQGKENLHHR
jgi:ATP/ADP translocase